MLKRCDTKGDTLADADPVEAAKRRVITQTLTGEPTPDSASAPAVANWSSTSTARREMRTASTSAAAWDTLSSTDEAASSASTVGQERWSASATQDAPITRPGIRQADRLFLRYMSAREMKTRPTSTSATAKILTQPCKENCMNRLLNILRTLRFRSSHVPMEVAVQHGGLLRLRPVVHCDRDLNEWYPDQVS